MDRVEYEKFIVQDLINQHRNKELNITPWYQRRSVWAPPQKAYLINTLFEKKPIPSLYIRHSLDLEAEKSIREVVDGQQRIRAILEYVTDGFATKHPNHKYKVKYSELTRSEAEDFRLTSLSVGFLLGATDEDVIEIFGRLNSVAKSLNAQEKRNAKFSGEFKQFCLRQASIRLSLWRHLNIFTANDIARMNEVQFISDLAFNMINGLSDYSSDKLDNIYRAFDEDFLNQEEISARFDNVFSKIASLDPSAIKDTIFFRQPLFFSLCLVLDSLNNKIKPISIGQALFAIDQNFNADTPPSGREKEDSEFYNACIASTQRIKSRKIRDAFIRKYLSA